MSRLHLSAILVLQAAVFLMPAKASTIFDSGITALSDSDPTQLGRLSRTGVPSDWSSQKPFPGVLNPVVPFTYHAFDIPIPALAPYVQVTFDDLTGTASSFTAAYYGSFVPDPASPTRGLDVNYLGDVGLSSNAFGTDPRVFQIIMPGPADLIVVVNDLGGSIGKPFRIIVEAFVDNMFTDLPPANSVPEPSSLALGFGGCVGIALLRRKRQQRGN